MSRQTLTQRKGLARYRDVQSSADTRTAGQHSADAREWSSAPADSAVQLYKPNTDLSAINRLIRILLIALLCWLAWAFTTPDAQLLLEMIRSQP